MEELRDKIFSFLNKKRKTPNSILKIKNKVFNYLSEQKKLFKVINEKDEEIPYITLNSGESVILDGCIPEVQSLFACDLGIDIQQSKFAKEILNYIKFKTINESPLKHLEKFSVVKNSKLYVSCGKKYIVTTVDNKIKKVLNGFEDVYFDSNFCFSEWEPDFYEEVNAFPTLFDVKAFDINTSIPDGVNVYTREMQLEVLTSWLIAAILKIKPLPILLFYGNKSSGKTLTSKAVMKLFMGETSNVSIFPDNKRSLLSCITSHAIYTIDNLDSKVPSWFHDTLTLVSTGGELSERALFSNAATFKKEIVSSVIITSRNGNFAQREDIKDRILPVFFESRSDYSISEDNLIDEVVQNRNRLMTMLFLEGKEFVSKIDSDNFKENYRFSKFGKLLKHRIEKNNYPFGIKELIKSIVNSQFESLTDIDPFIQMILQFDFKTNQINNLSGTPVELIKILESSNSNFINNLKPRVISRKIKENINVFELNNWVVNSEKYGNSTKFTFIPPSYK